MVKENAQLLNMPVVKGDFDRQIAKQDYYTERQELVLNQLIKQKASFELLHLSYEIELRKHWDIYRQLENLVHLLNQSNLMFHQRLEMLTDPSVSQQINPRNTIDTKDYSTHRLYRLLKGKNRKKELLPMEIWRSGRETKTGCFFGTTTVGRISSGIFFLSVQTK